jgi:hypothetical protein
MAPVDTARIVFWSLYLILPIPWTFYSCYRFYQYRNLVPIKERYPVLTLISIASLNLSAFSLALSRIIVYPCPVSLWSDWILDFMLPAFGIYRGMAHYFKCESSHEKVRFFKNGENGNEQELFFHSHRSWFGHRALTRNFLLLLVVSLPIPIYGSVVTSGISRNTAYVSDSICKPGFIAYLYISIFTICIIGIILIGFLIRKKNDVYNIREDLKHAGIFIMVLFILFYIFGLFGWVQGFALSSVMLGIGKIGVCYFVLWRPVSRCLEDQLKVKLTLDEVTGMSASVETEDSPFQMLKMNELSLFNFSRFKNFFTFLQSPSNRDRFESFVTEAFAIENLYFYDAMMRYYEELNQRTGASEPEIRNKLLTSALKIYEKFFHPDAVLLINISAKSRQGFDDAFSQAIQSLKNGQKVDELDNLQKFDVEALRSIYKECFDEVLVMLVDGLYRQFNSRDVGSIETSAQIHVKTISMQ